MKSNQFGDMTCHVILITQVAFRWAPAWWIMRAGDMLYDVEHAEESPPCMRSYWVNGKQGIRADTFVEQSMCTVSLKPHCWQRRGASNGKLNRSPSFWLAEVDKWNARRTRWCKFFDSHLWTVLVKNQKHSRAINHSLRAVFIDWITVSVIACDDVKRSSSCCADGRLMPD